MYTVLQINVVSNWGSTGRIAEEIGQTIIANGGTSYIAYSRGTNCSTSNLIHIGNKFDVYWHGLETRFLDRHGLASKVATINLIEQIKRIKPDIVHLHNLHGYYLNYPLFFNYLAKSQVPLVWTLHDCWSFTGHCAYFTFAKCEKWKSLCSSCPQLDKYPSSWFKDRSQQNFINKKDSFSFMKNMTLVPVSYWLSGLLEDSFLGRYPKKVIHNGINIATFNIQTISIEMRKELGVGDKFIVLGVANIWEDRKGLNDFLKLRDFLSDDYLIILIGVTLKQIANLPKGIVGITRTNSIKDLVNYYSLADVYVNPTWEDNFPTTNLEALACGTPVITYNTGGSVEAIDSNTGFIVDQGDIGELVSVIKLIKEKGKILYSQACRNRAVTFFDKNHCYEEYVKLYNKILK